MNKQEAIEKIEELKKYSCGALGDDWINLGIDKALSVVKQIDEPEKVVLTKEEAEWVEGLKKEQERRTFWTKYSMLYFITRAGFGYGFSYDHKDREIELKHYSHEIHAEKERLANAILYGYEVEKEQLYRARHKLTGEYLSQNYTKTGYYHGLDHFHILKLSKKDWEELGVLDDKWYEIEETEEVNNNDD